jgi:hypothetical protein
LLNDRRQPREEPLRCGHGRGAGADFQVDGRPIEGRHHRIDGDAPKVCGLDPSLLGRVPDNRNAFIALYDWLKSEHGATESRADLHNRTFAGSALMKRLLAAESKRIKRRHKLAGPKLKKAVNWSNGDSGPMETWRGRRLKGDALFIVPEGTPLNGDELLSPSAQAAIAASAARARR